MRNNSLLQRNGLLQKDIELIKHGISQFPEITGVILFGSRAKGNFKPGSDVDLAIKGVDITHTTVSRLSFMLNEEIPLPYFFDIVHYEKITEPELIHHIDRVGINFLGESAKK